MVLVGGVRAHVESTAVFLHRVEEAVVALLLRGKGLLVLSRANEQWPQSCEDDGLHGSSAEAHVPRSRLLLIETVGHLLASGVNFQLLDNVDAVHEVVRRLLIGRATGAGRDAVVLALDSWEDVINA